MCLVSGSLGWISYLMSPILTVMKHFALILLAALTWSVNAQITYPYNPDGNGDQYIAVYDLQDFLSAYGQEWIPGEIVVDSIPLSAYLEAMEALILANAMPAGTNPGQFLRWNGDGWELVMPKVGCTLPEACLLYTSPSPRDKRQSRMPSSA